MVMHDAFDYHGICHFLSFAEAGACWLAWLLLAAGG
jgi:hypothetical protein